MGSKFPSWLSPRLSSVPESFTVARARLAGQGRAKKCSEATLSRIGRQGGKAAALALTPAQRIAKATKAAKAANLSRWGWCSYTLSGDPLMSHKTFIALGVLEVAPAGMYPLQLYRASDGEVSYGHVHDVFRALFKAGHIQPIDKKNRWGRSIYVITQAGRDALAGMRALIVGGVP